MIAKLLMCWMAGGAICMARPGALDMKFDPVLRAWVVPDHATVAPDGRVWIGGGFDQGDGFSTGDLVRLGQNGGVESEPASGYLKRVAPFLSIGDQLWVPQNPESAAPFLLDHGDFLLRGESGGWLRMDANGRPIGKAFPDRQADEIIAPQFEQAGMLWVIRQSANGERRLERRHSVTGLLDVSFSPASELPTNLVSAVPGRDGECWVLVGDETSWDLHFNFGGGLAPEQKIFRLNADGSLRGQPRVISGRRSISMASGPAGSYRLIFGEDPSRWWYWPAPSSSSYRIEWYSAEGEFERRKDFYLRVFEKFIWAEGADGTLVAMNRRTETPGASQWNLAENSSLRRYRPDGTEDASFISPRGIRSVRALADGKWLVDGMRRLNANGSEDSSWKTPELSRSARIKTLMPLSGGKVLATGDFATVDGAVRNRMVVFRADGEVDGAFVLDPRIGEPVSVTVTNGAIYLISSPAVIYQDGTSCELVKVRLDGTLDESFRPPFVDSIRIALPLDLNADPSGLMASVPEALRPPLLVGRPTRVTAMANQELLVETSERHQSWNLVHRDGVVRLRGNGALVPGFKMPEDFRGLPGIFPLRNGGFISGGVFYRADGSVERDLTSPNEWLTPLCEVSGGILFRAAGSFVPNRLVLWTCNGFARWFQGPELDWSQSVAASAGEWGTIYLAATLANARPSIHRLLPNGRVDRSFRGPVFEFHERQFPRNWWKAEEAGKVAFDPAQPINRVPEPWPPFDGPQSILWHPSTGTVWAGGAFNKVHNRARDGLARIRGGFWAWRWN